MPLTGIVKTLFKDKNKTQPIFPRTVFSAVLGHNGQTWQEELDAKINKEGLVLQNKDANDYTESGIYYLTTGCTNVPSDYLTMWVMKSGTDMVIQVGFYRGDTIYLRRKSNQTWSAWKHIILS